ncbi:MAG: hypothetical protein Q9225_006236 [Loekoesia sp. 1 TL-2023]
MSSYWFNSTESAEIHSADCDPSHPPNLTSILAAIGNQLPWLPPHDLSYDKHLGKGSSFEVSRELVVRREDEEWEPYYVAVKRIVISERNQENLKRQYDSVMRELRVLTHPGLRHNNSIIPILAYGWTTSPTGMRPYLVMQYSEGGTLDEYLQNTGADVDERHSFALDVAYGLKDLHDSKIIHGDLKPRNVLIFESAYRSRTAVAKLADFGASIFELDEAQMTTYAGTPLYTARRTGGQIATPRASFYQDDIYAFGITLWETMNHGRSYIAGHWLMHGESRKDFLERIWIDEGEEAVLRRAHEFCSSLRELNLRTAMCKAIRETFDLTLKDSGSLRSTINEVIAVLSIGSQRERGQTILPKIYPPIAPANNQASAASTKRVQAKKPNEPMLSNIFTAKARYKFRAQASEGLSLHDEGQSADSIKQEPSKDEGITERSVTLFNRPSPGALRQFIPVGLNLLKILVLQSKLIQGTDVDGSGHTMAIAAGDRYGVEPDLSQMFRYLTLSLEGHNVAKAIYRRIVLALGSEDSRDIDSHFWTELDHALEVQTTPEDYFASRVRMHQLATIAKGSVRAHGKLQKEDLPFVPLTDLLGTCDQWLLSTTLNDNMYTDKEVSIALALACKQGNARAAIELCAYCKKFVLDPEAPTPLHWLIMFDAQEAEEVGTALVRGAHTRGPCKDLLDSVPSEGEGVFILPDHCLELFGTPLHWAVRTRNLDLVRLLCCLGANVNARWTTLPQGNLDPQRLTLPHLSPLDLAVQFHLPEIAEALIGLGAQWLGSSIGDPHSALHCIGQTSMPFSRYLLHGDAYRDALEQTLAVITSHGHALIIDHIPNINALDERGQNALHYSAITGNRAIASILCNHVSIDIDSKSSHTNTALHLAATFGSVDVLTLLIQKGACMEALDSFRNTALQLAVLFKKKDAADALIHASAEVIFEHSLSGNVLHVASADTGSQDTIVSDLLMTHPKLRSTSVLNGTDGGGRTPLHKAVNFGDHDAVHALLTYGANTTLLDSGGKTPHDLVSLLIKSAKSRTLTPVHKRIWQRPSHVRRKFVAALQEIEKALENNGNSDDNSQD